MILEIQVLPTPAGTPDDRYKHVEAAISVIAASGLRYEVDALGTTVEGAPDALWPLARGVHEATLAAGASSVITVIKLAQSADAATQSTIDSLTSKFRA